MSLAVTVLVDIPAGAIEVQPAQLVPAGRGVQITFLSSEAAEAYRLQLEAALERASALTSRQLPEPAGASLARESQAYSRLVKVRMAYTQAGRGCEGLLTHLYDRALGPKAGASTSLAEDFIFAAEATFSVCLAMRAQEQTASIYGQMLADARPGAGTSPARQRSPRKSPAEQGINIASRVLGAEQLPVADQVRIAELAASHVATAPASSLLMLLAGQEPATRFRITDVPSCSRLEDDGPLLPADWRLTMMPGKLQLGAALRDLTTAAAGLHEVANSMRSDLPEESGVSQALFSVSTLLVDAIKPLKAYQ